MAPNTSARGKTVANGQEQGSSRGLRFAYTPGDGQIIGVIPSPRSDVSSPPVSQAGADGSPIHSPTSDDAPIATPDLTSPDGSAIDESEEESEGASVRQVPRFVFSAANRLKLSPEGPISSAGYTPNQEASHCISEIITHNLKKFRPSWKYIPLSMREAWFQSWHERFTWDPKEHEYMWRAFNRKGSSRLSNIYNACKKKPVWMGVRFWNDLQKYRESDEFKKKSEANTKNRNSGKGGSLHTCGSLSMGTFRARLAEKLGRDPNYFDTFIESRKKKDGEWVERRARLLALCLRLLKGTFFGCPVILLLSLFPRQNSEPLVYEAVQGRLEERQRENPSAELTQEEISQIFQEVAGPPSKGRVYGLSFYTKRRRYIGPDGHVGSSEEVELLVQNVQNQVTRMDSDFREHMNNKFGELELQVTSQVGDLRNQLTEQRTQISNLDKTLQQTLVLFQQSQQMFQHNQAQMSMVYQHMQFQPTFSQQSPSTQPQQQPGVLSQQQPGVLQQQPIVSQPQTSFINAPQPQLGFSEHLATFQPKFMPLLQPTFQHQQPNIQLQQQQPNIQHQPQIFQRSDSQSRQPSPDDPYIPNLDHIPS